jgi:hypothetical protein
MSFFLVIPVGCDCSMRADMADSDCLECWTLRMDGCGIYRKQHIRRFNSATDRNYRWLPEAVDIFSAKALIEQI